MEAIVTIAAIKRKAQVDHAKNVPLNGCALPPMSAAAATWRAEWRRLEAEKKEVTA